MCITGMGAVTPLGMDIPAYTAALRAGRSGVRRLIGTSVKSMIGHPQGACGLASLVATVTGVGAGFVPPTANLRTMDPECDLENTASAARELDTRRAYVALINCLAFGAKNSAVIMRVAGPVIEGRANAG